MKRLQLITGCTVPDEVVKSVDLGVDQFENPDLVDDVRGIRTAVLLVMSRVDMVLAYCGPAKASRGKI